MSKPSVSSIRRLPSSLYCLFITFLVIAALWWSGFLSYCDIALYDYFLGLKVENDPQALNPQIIPVDLNDKSEMTLGERLGDRSAFGDLFSVIAHSDAHAVLDFIYQGEREKDKIMLDAAAGIRGVFVGIVPVPEGRESVSYRELYADEKILLRKHLWRPREFGQGSVPRAGTFVMPFKELGEIATQLSHLSIDPDFDGIYRRTPLFYAWEDGFIPAISLASALFELGVDGNDIEIHYGREVVVPLGPDESFSIPIDSSGVVLVPFRGKWVDTTHRYSFDVMANALGDEKQLNEVRNDILRSLCFVADTTFAKKDLGPIPFEKVYPLSGLHTWVISGILDASLGEDTFYWENSSSYRYGWLAIIVLFFLLLGIMRNDLVFNSGSAIIFLVFQGLTVYLWFYRRIIPWYAAGTLLISFSWLFGFIYRFLSQRKRQSALERYVPRSVAHKLVAGQRTNLEPMYKELTILFSDIKSFTTWSAEKEAHVVHDFLNEYLESMADILFKHNATVDKFMGDGILAFFGDPLDLPNHPREAIKAAVAMQKKIGVLRDTWKPKVGIDLRVRIGINTGNVIVGDLGTKRRIEYTVIGSSVNMAQRMESLATPGGILVTEYTKIALEKRLSLSKNKVTAPFFSFGPERALEVKGYDDKPIMAYDIIF